MNVRLAAPITVDSIVDGPGLRMVIWTQGCEHNCKGCHNPQTHNLHGGFEMSCDGIIQFMKEAKWQKGITLSGGEPFLQAEALLPIAMEAQIIGLNVWAYTGFVWEKLLDEKNPRFQENLLLLQQIDILVDGRFIERKQSVDLLFRGSSNQRIIDVRSSLKEQRVVLSSDYMERTI